MTDMPKIRDVRASAERTARVSAGLNERLASGPVAPPVPASEPVREPFPHAEEDHLTFVNADGTRSRVCICVCDDCWPSEAGKTPPPCEWSV